MYYFDAETAGFYHSDIHGPRRISIADPAWVRPLITVELQPGQSYDTGASVVENTAEAVMALESVPDWTAQPDMIEVDNPDCLIPSGAVEISAEEHAALLEGQASGKRIVAGADGLPELADQPTPSIDDLAVSARAKRDYLLSTCDWVVIKSQEAGTAVPDDWRAYRQTLRDITEQPGFPSEIVWPAVPGSEA